MPVIRIRKTESLLTRYLFDARVFSSYIYKKSNVLDFRLKDFYVADPEDTQNRAGIDMLLQSEKIKNELLNMEHDLWEY